MFQNKIDNFKYTLGCLSNFIHFTLLEAETIVTSPCLMDCHGEITDQKYNPAHSDWHVGYCHLYSILSEK